MTETQYRTLVERIDELQTAEALEREQHHAEYLRVVAAEKGEATVDSQEIDREKANESDEGKRNEASVSIKAKDVIIDARESTNAGKIEEELLRNADFERQINDFRMIALDVPRTMPTLRVFAEEESRSALKRVLMASMLLEDSVGFTQGLF